MKLYTEEEIKKRLLSLNVTKPDVFIEYLTPIELPSDEEIKKLELEYAINFGTNMGIGFKIGCQWMKEQILNQNK